MSLWRTVYNQDLSALSTLSLGSNTTYTPGDGLTWTKINSANADAFTFTSGSGLVMTPKSGSDYNGSTRTLPALHTPLNGIIPNFRFGMGLRIWARVSSYNGAANYDSFVMGVDSASAVNAWMGKRGHGTSSVGFSGYTQTSSVNTGFYASPGLTLNTANNVMLVEIPRFGEIKHNVDYGPDTGPTPTPWPAPQALRRVIPYDGTYYATGLNMQQFDISTAVLLLGAQRAGSGTALVCTVSHLRVDVRT